MGGFITERNLGQAEEAFPGISRFFESLSPKPRTFLDLISLFDGWCGSKEKERPGVHSGMLQRRSIRPAMEQVIKEVQG